MKKILFLLALFIGFTPIHAKSGLLYLRETPSLCFIEGQNFTITGKVTAIRNDKKPNSTPTLLLENTPCFYRSVGAGMYKESRAFNLIRIEGVQFHVLPVIGKFTGTIRAIKAKKIDNLYFIALSVKKWEKVK